MQFFNLSLKPETQRIIFESGGELVVFLFFLNTRAPFDVQPPPVITSFKLVPEAQKRELKIIFPGSEPLLAKLLLGLPPFLDFAGKMGGFLGETGMLAGGKGGNNSFK